MSVTSTYIESATGKRYHSIELADSFLLKYRYWTFAKITASALWKKFWTSGIATVSIYPCTFMYNCINNWDTCVCVTVCMCDCVYVWLCACVTVCMCDCVHVWLCVCVTVWLCACWYSYHSWFLLMEIVSLCLVNSITCKVHDSLEFAWYCWCMVITWLNTRAHKNGDLSKSV